MGNSASKEVELRKRRVALEGKVRVTPRSGEEPEVMKYTDLSMGGLFVTTICPLEIGAQVDLDLRLMRLPFKAGATVAWIRPYSDGPEKPSGMGLEFHELSSVQRKALYRQIGEALEYGGEAMPGTPPSAADLASRGTKAKKAKKGSLWGRLLAR